MSLVIQDSFQPYYAGKDGFAKPRKEGEPAKTATGKEAEAAKPSDKPADHWPAAA